MAAGAVSLKNLAKCEEVRKGADQANSRLLKLVIFFFVQIKQLLKIKLLHIL